MLKTNWYVASQRNRFKATNKPTSSRFQQATVLIKRCANKLICDKFIGFNQSHWRKQSTSHGDTTKIKETKMNGARGVDGMACSIGIAHTRLPIGSIQRSRSTRTNNQVNDEWKGRSGTTGSGGPELRHIIPHRRNAWINTPLTEVEASYLFVQSGCKLGPPNCELKSPMGKKVPLLIYARGTQ